MVSPVPKTIVFHVVSWRDPKTLCFFSKHSLFIAFQKFYIFSSKLQSFNIFEFNIFKSLQFYTFPKSSNIHFFYKFYFFKIFNFRSFQYLQIYIFQKFQFLSIQNLQFSSFKISNSHLSKPSLLHLFIIFKFEYFQNLQIHIFQNLQITSFITFTFFIIFKFTLFKIFKFTSFQNQMITYFSSSLNSYLIFRLLCKANIKFKERVFRLVMCQYMCLKL